MRDLVEVLVMIACFLAPFAIFGVWTWFWFGVAMIILFGLSEAYMALIHKDKMTLTEHFREFKKKNPKGAWICALSLGLGWVVLLWHLLR
jgi:hypothetical protein